MDFVFHNFNFLKFVTLFTFHIKFKLGCAMKYVIYGGEINSGNYRSGIIA